MCTCHTYTHRMHKLLVHLIIKVGRQPYTQNKHTQIQQASERCLSDGQPFCIHLLWLTALLAANKSKLKHHGGLETPKLVWITSKGLYTNELKTTQRLNKLAGKLFTPNYLVETFLLSLLIWSFSCSALWVTSSTRLVVSGPWWPKGKHSKIRGYWSRKKGYFPHPSNPPEMAHSESYN